MEPTSSTFSLSSLYSTGQCLLSVLGSIGVILLFAGIPQLIYAPVVSVGSIMTFILGVLLISTMVAGNAYIGYKYRELITSRQGTSMGLGFGRRNIMDDKPPTYDDVLTEDGVPPTYSSISFGKPPKYEDRKISAPSWTPVRKTSSTYSINSQTGMSSKNSSSNENLTKTNENLSLQFHLGESLDVIDVSRGASNESIRETLDQLQKRGRLNSLANVHQNPRKYNLDNPSLGNDVPQNAASCPSFHVENETNPLKDNAETASCSSFQSQTNLRNDIESQNGGILMPRTEGSYSKWGEYLPSIKESNSFTASEHSLQSNSEFFDAQSVSCTRC